RAEPDAGVLRAVTLQAEHHNELKFVDSIMERPTIRAGSIGVMLRDEQGKIQRLPGIGFFDTDQGRYVTTVKRGSDGEDWTTRSPTGPPAAVTLPTSTIGVVSPGRRNASACSVSNRAASSTISLARGSSAALALTSSANRASRTGSSAFAAVINRECARSRHP